MSWLEDKIKGWEASDDAGWLRAQLEVIALELSAAEKRAKGAELRAERLDNETVCCSCHIQFESRLRDAEARVGELEVLARECANNWVCDLPGEIVSEELCGRDKLCRRCMAIKALARPTLGAASRLRDEVLEEAAGILLAQRWYMSDDVGCVIDRDDAVEAIRARKSKETGR